MLRRPPISIRTKVTLLVGAAVVASLLISGVAWVLQQKATFRNNADTQLRGLSEILLGTIRPSLDFNDPDTARERLSALRANRGVRSATLYRKDGTVFAYFDRFGRPAELFPTLLDGTTFEGDKVTYIEWIPYGLNSKARLVLVAGVDELHQRESTQALLYLLVCLVITGVALVVYLQRVISRPILEIARTAESFLKTKDFSLRAPVRARDEIGLMAESFNRMLEAIGKGEKTLSENEKRYRALIQNSTDGLMLVSGAGVIVYESPSVLELIGYTQEERLGQSAFDFIHPDDLNRARESFSRLMARPSETITTELRVRHKNGSWRWVEAVGANLLHEPSIGAITANYRDITERRAAEENLRSNEARLRVVNQALVELARNPHIFTGDFARACRIITETAARVLDIELASVWLFCDGNRSLKCIDHHARSTREHMSGEVLNVADFPTYFLALAHDRYVDASDAQYDLRTREFTEGYLKPYGITSMLDAGVMIRGKLVGTICLEHTGPVRQWTTEECTFSSSLATLVELALEAENRRKAEEDLLKLNEELEHRVSERTADLEAANRELEAFSYSVSHDLRAPLRNIAGFTELLLKHSDHTPDETTQRHLGHIADGTRRMGMLIDDLLEFSRVGRSSMFKTPVSFDNLLRESLRDLATNQRGRNIVWQIHSLPTAEGDQSLLRQVLVNYLSNAIKYTMPRSEAQIEVGCVAEPQEWVFFVKDNGVGFDMRYSSKLFGVFQRLHSVDQFKGTGIGLANVRRIVNRHGGRTWAESELNQGSVFYFSLPRSARDVPPAQRLLNPGV